MSRRKILRYTFLACLLLTAAYFTVAVAVREYRRRHFPLDRLGVSIYRQPEAQMYLFNGTVIYRISSDRKHIYNAWEAVSGTPDAAGEFLFTEARQKVKAVGPIPAGRYRCRVRLLENTSEGNGIWSLEAWNRIAAAPGWRRLLTSGMIKERDREEWGDFFARLTPYPETNCFGRSFWALHGGAVKGSHGCIDAGGNDIDLFQDMLTHFSKAGGADFLVDYNFHLPPGAQIAIKPARWTR